MNNVTIYLLAYQMWNWVLKLYRSDELATYSAQWSAEGSNIMFTSSDVSSVNKIKASEQRKSISSPFLALQSSINIKKKKKNCTMLFKHDDDIKREDDSTVTHLLNVRSIPLQLTWAHHMWSACSFSKHIKRQRRLLKPIKVSVLTLNFNKRKPLSEHRCRLK